MSNRNFDSRTVIDRLQQINHARYIRTQQLAGQSAISNPQTSNADASTISLFQAGSPSIYQKGLIGGLITTQPGGTC